MKDSETFKEEVDRICAEISRDILHLDSSLHGIDLRNKIFDLNGYLSRFNALSDKARLKVGIQESHVDFIKSRAMQGVIADPTLAKVPATLKPFYVETYPVKLDDESNTTLYEEKSKLEYYTYAMNRFKSIFELLKMTIMSAQSGLSFDREEMKNIKYT